MKQTNDVIAPTTVITSRRQRPSDMTLPPPPTFIRSNATGCLSADSDPTHITRDYKSTESTTM